MGGKIKGLFPTGFAKDVMNIVGIQKFGAFSNTFTSD